MACCAGTITAAVAVNPRDTVADRKKNMIIIGGFNVFAAEVEAPLLALSEVLGCAVIGVPDEQWGEAIKAIVVLRDGQTLTESEAIESVTPKLGGARRRSPSSSGRRSRKRVSVRRTKRRSENISRKNWCEIFTSQISD